jgi:nitrogen fixation protein FixH
MTRTELMTNGRQRMHWIPKLFIGFFVFVLAINLIMIWLAVSTWTGLETDGAYQKGLDYNRNLEAARAQDELGWTVGLDVAAGDGRVRVAVDVEDRFGNLIKDATVRARLVRPTHEGHDLALALAHEVGGTYSAEAPLPLAGQWDVEIGIIAPTGTWRASERVFLEP